MNFLLYHPKTRTTGKALARNMGIMHGTRIVRFNNPADEGVLIRWGSLRGEDWPQTLNRKGAVQLAGSKYRALKAMHEAGLPVPEFSRNYDELETDGLVFGRQFRHMGGRDIQINDGDGYSPSDYYTAYIPPHKEYRVHVVGGTVIFSQKKYFRRELYQAIVASTDVEEHERLERNKDFIRNNAHGWGFHDMNDIRNVPRAVLDAAIEAVGVLRLDFGAVDVISTTKEDGRRNACILEVNTAPGLRSRNLAIYKHSLMAHI